MSNPSTLIFPKLLGSKTTSLLSLNSVAFSSILCIIKNPFPISLKEAIAFVSIFDIGFLTGVFAFDCVVFLAGVTFAFLGVVTLDTRFVVGFFSFPSDFKSSLTNKKSPLASGCKIKSAAFWAWLLAFIKKRLSFSKLGNNTSFHPFKYPAWFLLV